MFFFGARRILDAVAQHLPALGHLLAEIERHPAAVERRYPEAEAISIDYGVMERLGAGEVEVVRGEFGWDDVGSFRALETLLGRDGAGNSTLGETALLDAAGNILVGGKGRLVAAIGVTDLVIVATSDAVLVVPKERAQEVRELVRALASSGRDTYL
jgi:mannose-1-phosphate guanylyltransferase